MKICTIILVGYLSFGPALITAADNRVKGRTEYNIKITKEYDCYLGVPYGFAHLIGDDVYLAVNGQIIGPHLIVDVEAKKDTRGGMQDSRLVADLFCFDDTKNEELVHSYSSLLVCIEDKFPLRWWYNKKELNN